MTTQRQAPIASHPRPRPSAAARPTAAAAPSALAAHTPAAGCGEQRGAAACAVEHHTAAAAACCRGRSEDEARGRRGGLVRGLRCKGHGRRKGCPCQPCRHSCPWPSAAPCPCSCACSCSGLGQCICLQPRTSFRTFCPWPRPCARHWPISCLHVSRPATRQACMWRGATAWGHIMLRGLRAA